MLPPLSSAAAVTVGGSALRAALDASGSSLDRVVRFLLDRLVALVVAAAAAPIMVLIAALVRLTSPGPALYRSVRIGKDGRPFKMLKFRSMRQGADRMEASLGSSTTGPFFKVHDDARVTPLGRLLRRTSLDELPQVLNVLRGEMSLVGPRPLLPREAAALPAEVHAWRFSVPPGVTGLWQVSGRSRTTDATRLRMDRVYVVRRSLGLDLAILAKTPAAVLRAEGAC